MRPNRRNKHTGQSTANGSGARRESAKEENKDSGARSSSQPSAQSQPSASQQSNSLPSQQQNNASEKKDVSPSPMPPPAQQPFVHPGQPVMSSPTAQQQSTIVPRGGVTQDPGASPSSSLSTHPTQSASAHPPSTDTAPPQQSIPQQIVSQSQQQAEQEESRKKAMMTESPNKKTRVMFLEKKTFGLLASEDEVVRKSDFGTFANTTENATYIVQERPENTDNLSPEEIRLEGVQLTKETCIRSVMTFPSGRKGALMQEHEGRVINKSEPGLRKEEKALLAMKMAKMALTSYSPDLGDIVIGGEDPEMMHMIWACTLHLKAGCPGLENVKIRSNDKELCNGPQRTAKNITVSEKKYIDQHVGKFLSANVTLEEARAMQLFFKARTARQSELSKVKKEKGAEALEKEALHSGDEFIIPKDKKSDEPPYKIERKRP